MTREDLKAVFNISGFTPLQISGILDEYAKERIKKIDNAPLCDDEPTTEEIQEIENKFEIGKKYSTRSVCDHNCIYTAEIIRKTPKMVVIKIEGKIKRCKVHTWEGDQFFYPLGHYSMCPVISYTDKVED